MHELFRAKQLQAAKQLARARGDEAKRKGLPPAHLLQHVQVGPIQRQCKALLPIEANRTEQPWEYIRGARKCSQGVGLAPRLSAAITGVHLEREERRRIVVDAVVYSGARAKVAAPNYGMSTVTQWSVQAVAIAA